MCGELVVEEVEVLCFLVLCGLFLVVIEDVVIFVNVLVLVVECGVIVEICKVLESFNYCSVVDVCVVGVDGLVVIVLGMLYGL